MLLITIVLGSIIIGLLASTLKNRFPLWLFILAAFIGSAIGAALSFGDSSLFATYPFLNIWTLPLIFALLFVTTTLFADRRKIVANVLTDLFIIGSIIFILFASNSPGDYSGLFREELESAGIERVGQPIEGFNAFMYLEAFPGFEESDFDGVKSFEGIYNFEDGALKYERVTNDPVTSAEDVISEAGYKTLLENFSSRTNVKVQDETDIAPLLEKLREGDEVKVSYVSDDFSIWLPEGWYAHELEYSVLFTHDENLETPQNTEGYALGPQFQVVMQTMSLDELLEQNLWNEGSEFLVSKEGARIVNEEVTKIVAKAAGADGEILNYIFESTDGRIFTLSHYPYERGSNDTEDFERTVQTFMINYIDPPSRTVTSADDAPPGSIHNLPVPDAVAAVRTKIAEDLGTREGLVIVMTAYEKTWTNGCLDLEEPGEMCTEALVQGYEVTAEAQGQSFTYHTNENGSVLREGK